MIEPSAAPERRRIYDLPWLLLMLPPLFWSGNFVLGRAVAGQVPPIALAFWRWALGALIVLPLAWPHLRRDLPALRRQWRLVMLLSAIGIAVFNTFVYIGLNTTTALNAVMMQSAMPVLIVLMSFLLIGERITPRQAAGIAVSLIGAVTLIARGELGVLAGLAFNTGDLWVLAAVLSYAGYTALVRRRPPVHPMTFLLAIFAPGALMLLPFYLWESDSGRPLILTPVSAAAIAYVSIFPSILAYLAWNRSVELVGPNRTGLSVHLMPVFGSLLAIGFLGERPRFFHAVGIGLIAIGIVWANRR
jgi:drug/metabolite transporter (DMT)-like permease